MDLVKLKYNKIPVFHRPVGCRPFTNGRITCTPVLGHRYYFVARPEYCAGRCSKSSSRLVGTLVSVLRPPCLQLAHDNE